MICKKKIKKVELSQEKRVDKQAAYISTAFYCGYDFNLPL